MLHRVAALFQLFLLAFNQVRILQLLILELQEIAVLAVTLDSCLQLCQFLFGSLISSVCLLVFGQLGGIVGKDIYHL